MSSLLIHSGSSPDLFLIICAVASLGSALITLRARSQRLAQRRSAHK